MPVFEWRSPMPASARDVYDWHARDGAFERLTAPWQEVHVVERSGGVADGAVVVFDYRAGALRGRWVAQHLNNDPGHRFADRQLHGPFALWEHTHSFIPDGKQSSVLEDHVEFQLPYGAVTDLFGGVPAHHALERLFRFRHARTRNDIERWRETRDKPRLRIAITGATGLIGTQVTAFLLAQGHDVVRIVRGLPERETDIVWRPEEGRLAAASLEGVDAVVHLAGESTGARWTASRRARIMRSRADGTALLAHALAGMSEPPKVLLSASAVGYYGEGGDQELTEESRSGDDFLAAVTRRWEAALDPARQAGIRVVPMRFGVVMSGSGGALARMLPAFRAGAGGPMGSGEQWWSWIALDDLVAAVAILVFADDVEGPVDVTSPLPLRNRDFVKTLGHVLRRPAVVPLPTLAIKTMFGQMGETMLLTSQRVLPRRLEELGFRFAYPELEAALRVELGRSAA
jgi:uncharacterized protein (TIGR01777 family)